jgi:meso-butanediol dehydrogenase/(S,S)-butanediol dehydrogenase/diacetyl reductase
MTTTAPYSADHRFKDRVALITGAASGIGLAIACRLGSEGARVVLADRNADGLTAAVAHCKAAGAPEALPAVCDVTDEKQVAAATDLALARFQRLDIIVNNAGLMLFAKIEDQTADDWLRILKVDLIGAFFFTREAFRKMPAGGAIVNIASIHALVTSPMVAPYAAAKAGLLALTRSAAIEGKAKGIRVNAVLPGAIDTPMLWDNPNVRDGIEKVNPQEVGKPADVAAAVAFLASDDARFIEGATLQVDGGRLDHL